MPANLTLQQAQQQFKVPVRKLAFLVRTGKVDGVLEGDKLLIAEDRLAAYLRQPDEIIQKHHVSYLKTLGPGLITGASDDDPSGIGTYSSVGSTYGLGLSWLAVYLLPMMVAVQETVARIGIVTQSGLAHVIGRRYGRSVLYPIVGLLLIANTVNIGADIGAMAASLQLLIPVNFIAAVVALTIFMTALEILVPYHRYSHILKWLTLSLVAYILTGFIIKPDWAAVLRSLVIPKIQLNAAFLAAMVAVMGTTITPYLFFWQASEEVEQELDEGEIGDFQTVAISHEIGEMRKDTYTGMALANVVFLFIVVTTAFVLHDHGITNIDSAQKAALALRPLAGKWASLLFTLGIFGTGLLAVPVLAGASAYAVAELFHWREGLSERFRSARGFYLIIAGSMLAGMLLNFIGINPIKALYYAAIVNGIIAPVLMFFIFRIGRDEARAGSLHQLTHGEHLGLGRHTAHGRLRHRAAGVHGVGAVGRRDCRASGPRACERSDRDLASPHHDRAPADLDDRDRVALAHRTREERAWPAHLGALRDLDLLAPRDAPVPGEVHGEWARCRPGGRVFGRAQRRREHARLHTRAARKEAAHAFGHYLGKPSEVGPERCDLLGRRKRHVDVLHAVVVLLDRELGHRRGIRRQAERQEHLLGVLERVPRGHGLLHPAEGDARPLALQRDGHDAGTRLEVDAPKLHRCGEHEGSPEDRVSGERDLPRRREDANARVPARLWREHERRLREVELAREGEHLLVGEAARIGEDAELVAGERAVGEDVDEVEACGG